MSLERFNPILSAYISCAHNFQNLKRARVKVRLTLGRPRQVMSVMLWCIQRMVYFTVMLVSPNNFKENTPQSTALICHQCGTIHKTKLPMITHTQWFIYKPRLHHLLGTHLNKHGTKHGQQEGAENWITTSPLFALFFSFFLTPSKLASRETARLLMQSSERWANPTVDPQEERGRNLSEVGDLLPWGGGTRTVLDVGRNTKQVYHSCF